ncbi:MAG: F0F1 ATP synthase subunit epsilon [Pirellulales bacterium]|nr:F0F1 ATP synthase subunit epsilon [Pirellulales bacterium]
MSQENRDSLQCVVVTPEETVIDVAADFVAIPLFDGEVGIGLNHSPMIGRLGYGELRIGRGEDTTRHYVDGGFVQVADNQVSVLTNRAIPAEDVDGDVAAELLRSALGRKASGDEQLTIRERTQAQARAQLRMARKGLSRPN